MCWSSDPPRDNSAEVARQQAVEREGKITQGRASIDKQFGIFDPQYFQNFQNAYTENYNPQVDKQFNEARQAMKYNLARGGMLDSTAGQKSFGDLVTSYNDARRDVASQAVDATNKLRSDIDSAKGDLYAQNSASADPSLSSIQAVSRAGSLQSPASYSPLGDLFSGAANAGASYLQGRQARWPSEDRGQLAPGAMLPRGYRSSGSGRVVPS